MTRNGTLLVSDAHLGAAPEENERAFHAFLESVPDRTRDLVVNGDLFDFWFEYRSALLRRHFRTLHLLTAIVDAGVRVRFVGGNHDFWGGSFLREELGIELLDGPLVTEIGGRRAYLAHGDGLGTGDLGYRILKTVIRSAPARRVFRLLHPDLGDRLVRIVSRTESRGDASDDLRSRERARLLREHALGVLRADADLELVVLGHCHRPELAELAPGRWYLNTGDWVRHCSWGEVDARGVRLRRLDGREEEGTFGQPGRVAG
jgi:UDP-2,3-diacylglucosamine hydrolase